MTKSERTRRALHENSILGDRIDRCCARGPHERAPERGPKQLPTTQRMALAVTQEKPEGVTPIAALPPGFSGCASVSLDAAIRDFLILAREHES
ncbi:MAG: hypothetical protein K1X88_17375 [Nannocystaceae bacterium]|nr:hypothetical protein [Nannocystaceae bacterium]